MASSDDDEDLKRALAISLEESKPSQPTIVIDSDAEDEDVRRAVALSLQDDGEDDASLRTSGDNAGASATQNSLYASELLHNDAASQQSLAAASKSAGNATPGGLLGMDRKAMERERLARLGKRKRSTSPERTVKAPSRASSATPAAHRDLNNRPHATSSGVQYARGAVKRTFAVGYPRTDDITIEELLQTSTLNIAVLSAFQLDDKWVHSKIDAEKIKQLWIFHAKGEHRRLLEQDIATANIPNFKAHFPPMHGQVSSMHSKLMLLFHPTHLRVVVPTANLTNFDWGETNKDRKGEYCQPAVLENTVFLVDIPRHSDGQVGSAKDLTLFGKALLEFLEAQGLAKNVTEGVLKFDFSATDRIDFVHSMPGVLTERYANCTGLAGLAKAVRQLGMEGTPLALDYVASSLGAVKEPFLKQLYAAAGGRYSADPEVPKDFLDRVSIYYPSQDTVRNSTGGPDCAGIITLSQRDYNEAFPKQCMRDYKSTRKGVLSHNKMLLVRGKRKDGKPLAWAYIGSANLSESAWGSQRILKSGKHGKLNVRNWECGVIVAVPEEDLANVEDGQLPPLDVFRNTVEIPFQYPAELYGDKEPWFYRDFGR